MPLGGNRQPKTHCPGGVLDPVTAMLTRSATVKVLPTTREGWGVADEQLWLASPLDVDAGPTPLQ